MKRDEPHGFVSRGVAPRLGFRALGRVPSSLTSPAKPARFLYVVARDRPDLYAALRENFVESTRLGIVLDRRADAAPAPMTHAERRRVMIAELLKTRGWARVRIGDDGEAAIA